MLANSDNDETGAAAPGVACVSPTPAALDALRSPCALPPAKRSRGAGAGGAGRCGRGWRRAVSAEHALTLPQPAVCGFPAAKCWPMSNGLYILHTCTLLHVNTRGATALTRDPCTTRREFLRSLPGI